MDAQRGTLHLSRIEKIALDGLKRRERQLFEEQQAYQLTLREYLADVEERLGLEPGALQRTHRLDAEQGVIEPLSPPTPEPERGTLEADLPVAVAAGIANGALPPDALASAVDAHLRTQLDANGALPE